MKIPSPAGFEELPHTADWALRVWAPDLPSLFAESARGMYSLAGVTLSEGPRASRSYAAEALDPESLLVGFLSELLYAAEHARLAFDRFDIALQGNHLNAEMSGAPLRSITQEIKAVTFHNLRIEQTGRGREVEIVFDV